MQSYLEDIAEHPTAFRLEEFDEGVLQIGAPFYAYIYQDGELKSNSKIYYPILYRNQVAMLPRYVFKTHRSHVHCRQVIHMKPNELCTSSTSFPQNIW